MAADLLTIFYWWLILLGLGFLAAPFSFRLFAKFWDRGWIFSKILGIVFVSYLVFFLGRVHLFPFYRSSIWLILIAVSLLNVWRLVDNRNVGRRFLSVWRKNWKYFLAEELLFLAALVFWSLIRGFQPNIEGLEKFMDFGFVNSILRSKWFPPQDMWFAGAPINYYYFGHLQAAVLTKISQLDSAVTYNLMIATIFSLSLVAALSLVSNLVWTLSSRRLKSSLRSALIAGLISAFLLALGGNLHAFIYGLKGGLANYWYPDATRFIGYHPNNPNDKTIHEFPSYSFVVADLHGHMDDIPTVLLFLAVLLALAPFFFKAKQKLLVSDSLLRLGLPAFLLAVMYMTNSWDFPIYGGLLAIFLFLVAAKQHGGFSRGSLAKLASTVILSGVVILALSIILALPWSISFSPMVKGIGLVRAHSLWWQLLVLWGFFWFLAAVFWIFFWQWLRKQSFRDIAIVDLFVFSFTLWATVLIFTPEVIYVKDIYIAEYHRANTMFKLVYQSFIMYSLAAGYIVFRVKKSLSFQLSFLFLLIFALGFSAQMLYPFLAIRGYYGRLLPSSYKGLYGMGFLQERYPSDYAGVVWLKKNVVGQPVVLEATGDSYTLYNRVSAMTGLPTIQGWLVHEWLWRGSYDKPGTRAKEVEAIYQGADDSYAKSLLKKYKVEYVFIGDLERRKYPGLDEDRFKRWGKLAFSKDQTKIYRLIN
jgi:uncharacterized membrane protein